MIAREDVTPRSPPIQDICRAHPLLISHQKSDCKQNHILKVLPGCAAYECNQKHTRRLTCSESIRSPPAPHARVMAAETGWHASRRPASHSRRGPCREWAHQAWPLPWHRALLSLGCGRWMRTKSRRGGLRLRREQHQNRSVLMSL